MARVPNPLKRSWTYGCAMCSWEIDISPWLACRTISWPRPLAALMFRLHRWSAHGVEYREWREHYDREHGQ